MFDVKLKRKLSRATIVIIENPLTKEVIKLKAKQDKMYEQLARKLFRFTLLADIIYHECLKKRKNRLSLPKWDYFGLQFELFFFYLRSIYDYFPIIIEKETGQKNLPASFNDLLRKHIKSGKLAKFEKKMNEKFSKFMKDEQSFQKIKDIRDSIKMKTTTLDVYIKDNLIYVSGEYNNFENKKVKIDEKGSQLVFNYCWMTAGWMIVLNDLIQKNRIRI